MRAGSAAVPGRAGGYRRMRQPPPQQTPPSPGWTNGNSTDVNRSFLLLPGRPVTLTTMLIKEEPGTVAPGPSPISSLGDGSMC